MTSKTSLLSGGIFKYNMKRYTWVSALYAFLLFMMEPYRILNNKAYYLDRAAREPEYAYRFICTDGATFALLVCAAVILGVCVFQYMQKTRSATLFHALPVNRKQLYLTATLSGIVLLALPIFLNGIILGFMSILGGFYQVLPLPVVGDWVVNQLITGSAVLCFTIFVGVFTGSSVAQALFVPILDLLPVAVVSVASSVLDGWLFGFTSAGMNPIYEKLLQIMPVYFPQFFHLEGGLWWMPILHGGYIVFFTILGLVFYQKRDVERAGDIVAFPWVKPIFLYGVTFCAMLFGTAFFTVLNGRSYQESTVGLLYLLVFALLGYAVAKILLLKSFRILPYYKGYLVCAALILITYSAVDTNVFGFGTHVPEIDQVARAYIGDYYYTHAFNEDAVHYASNPSCVVVSDKEEIAMILALHGDMIEAGELKNDAEREGKRTLVVGYELENGRRFIREYWGDTDEFFAILSTDGAKDYIYPNFRVYPERIRYISFEHRYVENQDAIYGEKKEGLIAAVNRDLERLSYTEINQDLVYKESSSVEVLSDGSVVTVSATPKDIKNYSMMVNVTVENGESRDLWFSFNSNFTETLAWLNANGYVHDDNAGIFVAG